MTFIKAFWEEEKPAFISVVGLSLFAVALIIFGAVFIAGQAAHGNGIHEGAVVGKSHSDASISTQCSGDGKSSVCVPVNYPETWDVKISQDGETNTFSIPKDRWDEVQKGDRLTFDGDTLVTE